MYKQERNYNLDNTGKTSSDDSDIYTRPDLNYGNHSSTHILIPGGGGSGGGGGSSSGYTIGKHFLIKRNTLPSDNPYYSSDSTAYISLEDLLEPSDSFNYYKNMSNIDYDYMGTNNFFSTQASSIRYVDGGSKIRFPDANNYQYHFSADNGYTYTFNEGYTVNISQYFGGLDAVDPDHETVNQYALCRGTLPSGIYVDVTVSGSFGKKSIPWCVFDKLNSWLSNSYYRDIISIIRRGNEADFPMNEEDTITLTSMNSLPKEQARLDFLDTVRDKCVIRKLNYSTSTYEVKDTAQNKANAIDNIFPEIPVVGATYRITRIESSGVIRIDRYQNNSITGTWSHTASEFRCKSLPWVIAILCAGGGGGGGYRTDGNSSGGGGGATAVLTLDFSKTHYKLDGVNPYFDVVVSNDDGASATESHQYGHKGATITIKESNSSYVTIGGGSGGIGEDSAVGGNGGSVTLTGNYVCDLSGGKGVSVSLGQYKSNKKVDKSIKVIAYKEGGKGGSNSTDNAGDSYSNRCSGDGNRDTENVSIYREENTSIGATLGFGISTLLTPVYISGSFAGACNSLINGYGAGGAGLCTGTNNWVADRTRNNIGAGGNGGSKYSANNNKGRGHYGGKPYIALWY